MDVVRRSHQRSHGHDIAIVAAGLPKVTLDLAIGLSLRQPLQPSRICPSQTVHGLVGHGFLDRAKDISDLVFAF